MTIKQEIDVFVGITNKMNEVFANKRQDYGQTTTETFKKFGPLSMYIRMCDKMGRLENLMVNEQTDHIGETVEDTLLDLANYAIITILEMRKYREEVIANSGKDLYSKRN